MPAERLSMRKIKEILRLKFELGLKNREIARSCLIPHTTVANYLRRARDAGLTWPLPPDLDEGTLERQLFADDPWARTRETRLPDFASIHEEFRRHRHVTLQLLWEEYKESQPDGYQYSRFCELYNRWVQKLDLVLRQDHRVGEKMFVDHAGPTVPIVDRETGQVHEAAIFVAVLGASNYTYAEATWNRNLASWIGSHIRTLEFFQGVPAVTVPDNWKTAVKDPCYYEPDLNPTYRDFAQHYGTVIIPARVRKPRDKAKVEAGVLIVERWILAALRKHTFHTLAELNLAIRELLVKLNQRKFRKLDTTREKLFEELERPALKPLPPEPFTFAEWKKARANIDYHVEIERHYYSVPYQLVHQEVEARIAAATVEIFLKGRRIVTHTRSFVPGKHTTLPEHRPKKHQNLEWTASRMIERGLVIGTSTAAALERIMESRKHPELGYRSCLGVLRLGERYGRERLETACRRAVALNACSYRRIKSMLETGLDRQPLEPVATPAAHTDVHANVRGAGYYRKTEVS
ncbi:MAG TPA: IS21 family transposase [Terriglobales bacterium]|nr:IS21 family transposase [Terriglobales bacterium]